MINDWKNLTSNAKKACLADFFLNLGRTLPHAILTVFLLKRGYSLQQIINIQAFYMIVGMITEFLFV